MKRKLILIVFIVLLIGVGGLVYWGQHQEQTAELYYSGIIEATQANIAFQVSGRVQEVPVDEGQAVKAGSLLAVLFRGEFAAHRDQARANLKQQQNNLAQLETVLEVNRKVLPAEVERAEASEKALAAQLAQAESGYRPQELKSAQLAADEARAALEDARRNKERYDHLFSRNVVAERDRDTAKLRFETALKEYGRAYQNLAMLREGYRREDIETARARLKEAQAAVKLARSNLKKIEVAEQEVAAARARLEAAGAALDLAEIQLDYTELRAPFDGVIVSRNIEPGEVVSPGQEVISISDLSEVDLKVFVPETEIGKVKPGQSAAVKVDTFPDKTYQGAVAFISPEGEFTPKIIQTHKERVKLVFLVKITIPNPNLELKTGMPADAWFR
ncbi:MAG: efflux RND transporter periplasmic adaptor subunit [Deltaproteobacteria bacterium]|nr:efflux RND transporter periplasmic adaptor subunit [Deltaproteobacteria bacterium]